MNPLARRPLPHMTTDDFLAWPGDGTGRKFHWLPDPEYAGEGERLRLPSVALDCPVEDAYRGTWMFRRAGLS